MHPPRPSGPGWEKYKSSESKHWQENGKGSGKYYNHNGQRWRLDRKSENGQPFRSSPKSVDVKNTESSKQNTVRQDKINGQTHSSVDPKSAQNKRAYINGNGKQAHHNSPIDRVYRGLMQKYGGKIPDSVRKIYAKQGVYFGDDPRNLIPADPKQHSAIHSQYHKLDGALKKLQQQADFVARRGPGMMARGVVPWLAYVPELDERFGGHINNGINNGFDYFRSRAIDQLQQLADGFASRMPPQGGSYVDYGQ